tara:strand:- start:10285 stop:10866 length:582 start_codon:yes stop_codon:yes gene_type:complete
MRRALDAYLTPSWQTRALLRHQPINGVVLEPCAGDGGIARVILDECKPDGGVYTNDINEWCNAADSHWDAALDEMQVAIGAVDWIVTNPPYTQPVCRDIVMQSVKHARVGVAMLLRLSFLEPTAKKNPRGPWLKDNPPSRILVLPRHSYTQDGKSDSCTTAWMIWLKRRPWFSKTPCIECLHDADVVYGDPLG